MSLDLFTRNADDAVAYAARVSAPELPSTFSDNFGEAWNRGYLTAQSISGWTRQITARSQLVDEAINKTGDQSFSALLGQEGGGFDMEAFNAKVAAHKAARPELDLPTMNEDTIQQRADEIGAMQLQNSRNFARRERTTGGAIGQFVGSAAASFTDPVNLVAFPLAAPESLGVLGTALAWSAIGGGSQALIETLNSRSMDRIQPGYSTSGEPIANILEAGAFAGVLGGSLKGLSSLWTRYKTGTWPRTVRDAGNVVDSEAQIASTNPMPGVEGEAAHRTALQKAIDDLASGKPVDVDAIIQPEQAKFIEAWHGSPHDFDRFDINRIGSGEGAQSFGHGLYFAEQKGTAMFYRDALSQRVPTVNGRVIGRGDGKFDIVDDFGVQAGPFDTKAEADRSLAGTDPGALYKVRISADRNTFLDWDKRLGEQPDQVKTALANAGLVDVAGQAHHRGQEIYSAVLRDAGYDPAKASQVLAESGISGIKYLDQGSRTGGFRVREEDGQFYVASDSLNREAGPFSSRAEAETAAKAKEEQANSRNFVVFDDKAVEITHKNGKPLKPEVRQAELDHAAGRPPLQAEMPLEQPLPPAKDLNTPTTNALREEMTPTKIEELRSEPDLAETVSRDLDKLMLEKPDLEVPTGVTVDADGRTVSTTRKVEDVVAEADARLAAAKEIEACVGPYPAEAA